MIKDMRVEQLDAINEDLSYVLLFKEKRLSQAEAGKICVQVTEEIMTLKKRKRELGVEKCLKRKRSEVPSEKSYCSCFDYDSDLSNYCNRSRSVTPSSILSQYSSSVTSSSSLSPSPMQQPKATPPSFSPWFKNQSCSM